MRLASPRQTSLSQSVTKQMKKLIIILAAVAAILPAAAFANHLDGVYQGYGRNSLRFTFGNNQRASYGHGGDVQFVDHRGRPFNRRNLRRGHPIRVEYAGDHSHRTVRRVIVQQRNGNEHHGRGDHHRR